MRKLFLYYDEKANVNYSFIFALFTIAESNKLEKLDNVITYRNQQELIKRIQNNCGYKISASSISTILNDIKNYNKYFTYCKAQNTIILQTNFRANRAKENRFVILNDREINFLLQQDNKQLTKYYLYLKYYCGYSKTKRIDTTANQILQAIGYSANCGNNKQNLSTYNKLLVDNGFLYIERITDDRGYNRNIYSIK